MYLHPLDNHHRHEDNLLRPLSRLEHYPNDDLIVLCNNEEFPFYNNVFFSITISLFVLISR